MLLEHSDKKLNAPTRATGEATLRAFAPRMGKRYTNGRNYDRGASNHRDVSMLSPYLRRRLVLEQEAIATAGLACRLLPAVWFSTHSQKKITTTGHVTTNKKTN